jgi:hypothetical protein
MFNELRDFINSVAPNLTDLLNDAFKLFERLELEDFHDEYVTALMMSGSVDINQTVDKIMSVTHDLLDNVLAMHEIYLHDDASVSMQIFYINAILDIQTYDDLTTIGQIAKMHDEPNVVFSELVALVTHKNANEIMIDIEKVNPAFIGVVRDYAENIPEELNEAEIMQKQKYIDLFNLFASTVDVKDLIITTLLNTGLDLGFPFSVYMNVIGSDLDEMKVGIAARNLVVAALVSSDGCDNPLTVINKVLDTYISDLTQITKVSVTITDLLLKFNIVKGK